MCSTGGIDGETLEDGDGEMLELPDLLGLGDWLALSEIDGEADSEELGLGDKDGLLDSDKEMLADSEEDGDLDSDLD